MRLKGEVDGEIACSSFFFSSFKEIAELMQPNTIFLVKEDCGLIHPNNPLHVHTLPCTSTSTSTSTLPWILSSLLFSLWGLLDFITMQCLFFVLFFIPSIKHYNTVKLNRTKSHTKKIILTTHYQIYINPHFSLENDQRNLLL